jgi:hypothetical protein
MTNKTTKEKRSEYRDFYYKHHERYKASARERAARQRREHPETPEQAEARRVYMRAWHAKKRGDVDFSAMSERDKTLFKLILIGLLNQKREQIVAHRRNWKRRRHSYAARQPKQPQLPKAEKLKLDPEERSKLSNERQMEIRRKNLADPQWRENWNAYKRAHQKRQLEKAKSDPVKLATLRASRREAGQRWLEKMKTQEPDRYARYVEAQSKKEAARRARDPQRRVSTLLRTQIYAAIRRQLVGRKARKSLDLIGCSPAELMAHLETQFEPGMSWSNFGRGRDKWCIDHKQPCVSFHLADPEEQKRAFHFSNLQPMWFTENCAKGSVWEGERWASMKTRHFLPPVQTPTV